MTAVSAHGELPALFRRSGLSRDRTIRDVLAAGHVDADRLAEFARTIARYGLTDWVVLEDVDEFVGRRPELAAAAVVSTRFWFSTALSGVGPSMRDLGDVLVQFRDRPGAVATAHALLEPLDISPDAASNERVLSLCDAALRV